MIEKTLCKKVQKDRRRDHSGFRRDDEPHRRIRKAVSKQAHDFPGGVAQPAVRALAAIGVNRLDQLVNHREVDLMKLHGMGPKALGALKAALAEKGLAFTEQAKPKA